MAQSPASSLCGAVCAASARRLPARRTTGAAGARHGPRTRLTQPLRRKQARAPLPVPHMLQPPTLSPWEVAHLECRTCCLTSARCDDPCTVASATQLRGLILTDLFWDTPIMPAARCALLGAACTGLSSRANVARFLTSLKVLLEQRQPADDAFLASAMPEALGQMAGRGAWQEPGCMVDAFLLFHSPGRALQDVEGRGELAELAGEWSRFMSASGPLSEDVLREASRALLASLTRLSYPPHLVTAAFPGHGSSVHTLVQVALRLVASQAPHAEPVPLIAATGTADTAATLEQGPIASQPVPSEADAAYRSGGPLRMLLGGLFKWTHTPTTGSGGDDLEPGAKRRKMLAASSSPISA